MEIRAVKCFAILIAVVISLSAKAQEKPVFPGKSWEKRKPASAGIAEDAVTGLGKLMETAHANGVLIKNGYLVAEWNYDGPSDQKIEVQSITKSITAIVLGLALQEGKIAAIDDPVKKYYSAFNVGPHTDKITFWHLVTASSGIAAKRYGQRYVDPGNMVPGIESRYTNDHLAELSTALTYIYGEPLINILRSRVLNTINADVDWRFEKDAFVKTPKGKEVPVNAGFAFSHWNASDLARVGWLFANDGKWKGKQLVPKEYVRQSITAIPIPVMPFSRTAVPDHTPSKKTTYGFAWRGYYTNSGRLIWYMSGNGGQMCVVLPEEGIVFTKINGISEKYQPFTGMDKFESLLMALKKK